MQSRVPPRDYLANRERSNAFESVVAVRTFRAIYSARHESALRSSRTDARAGRNRVSGKKRLVESVDANEVLDM